MPQETDPSAAAPVPAKSTRVITNDPRLADMSLPGSQPIIGGNTGEAGTVPGERVALPSRGLCYPEGHPARAGFVMVRPITTREEEILVTERYAKQGTTIDMILSRCILTKGINTLDLISGDRIHILFYLRAISYGPEYTFRAKLRDGSEQDIKTDVSKLTIVTLPDNFTEPWVAQVDGTTYELRLSRGKDEQEITQERMRLKKKNPNAPDPGSTLNLKRQIVSFNGEQDPEAITQFVGNMIARTAQRLRAEIAKVNPGPKMKLTVVNESTGEEEEIALAITETFFRADTESD